MLATFTAALLLAAPPATPVAAPTDRDAPAAKRDLFAGESWYKDQKGDEKDFVGVLSKIGDAPKGVVGFGRTNPYRLTMTDDGKQVVREVYVGGHPELLAPYVGKKIKLVGKAVDMEVEGQQHAEIWPSRLELLDAAPPEPAKELPARLDILISNKAYVADATPEKEYVGVLEKKKGEDAVGYVLAIDTGDRLDRQDLHLFDPHYSLFDPYAGMRVKIVGKKLTGEVRGTAVAYILPGRLELLPAAGDKTGKELKVLARATWTPVEGAAPVQLVIRSPEELATAHGQSGDKAKDEGVQTRVVEEAARLFKVEAIDWKTQMIVVASAGAKPTGGYSVDITGLSVQDDVLNVHWKVNAPKPGDFVTQAFTHPAQAVLTERVEGKAVFDAPPKTPAPGK